MKLQNIATEKAKAAAAAAKAAAKAATAAAASTAVTNEHKASDAKVAAMQAVAGLKLDFLHSEVTRLHTASLAAQKEAADAEAKVVRAVCALLVVVWGCERPALTVRVCVLVGMDVRVWFF